VCCSRVELLYARVSGTERYPPASLWQLPTLQKSIDLMPLLPSAGPTGGLGLAWPAPTMILTTWSMPPTADRALDIFFSVGYCAVSKNGGAKVGVGLVQSLAAVAVLLKALACSRERAPKFWAFPAWAFATPWHSRHKSLC
jgi:hypothetical protein